MTVQERFDETTRRSAKMVLEHKGDKYQPAISIVNDKGDELAQYYLPTNAYLIVEDGQKVDVGDILVKVPREATRTKDITGVLPVLQNSLKLVCQKILQLLQILMVKLCLVVFIVD